MLSHFRTRTLNKIVTENAPLPASALVESESQARAEPRKKIHLASPIIDDEMKAAAVAPKAFPSRADESGELAAQPSLSHVEDACQAHGDEFKGRKEGSIGDAGCLSFYPAKTMTVGGDGGIITSSNGEIADTAPNIRD